MPEPHTRIDDYADELISTPRAHLASSSGRTTRASSSYIVIGSSCGAS